MSSASRLPYIVSPIQCKELLEQSPSEFVPLCAAWFLPNDAYKRSGRQVFRESRIPGARFFDLDVVCDRNSPYPHMLPSAEAFAAAMADLGIKKDQSVIVYDTKELGIFSAPRVAWMLKVFKHPKVHILNNYLLWVQKGYPTDTGDESRAFTKTEYPTPDLEDLVESKDFDFMENLVRKQKANGQLSANILDARPAGRFFGRDPEPRPGLPSGHMPGSISLPFNEVLDPDSKAFLPPEHLRKVLSDKIINGSLPIVSTCGTGVSAAVIDAAIAEAGTYNAPQYIYDGSWTEWAQRVNPKDELVEQSAG